MLTEGKMAPVGLTRIEEAKKSGEWFKTRIIEKELVIPKHLEEALAANNKALDFFNSLANSYRRNLVAWIVNAKKEETRRRRVAEVIRLLEKNKKLGMK
jgi:uncharacterized protein YdeI (YjbR/CyaY-like superfamily)